MKLFTSKLNAVLLSACMVLPVLSNGMNISAESEKGSVTVTVYDEKTGEILNDALDFSIIGGNSAGYNGAAGDIYVDGWNTEVSNPHMTEISNTGSDWSYTIQCVLKNGDGFSYNIDTEKSKTAFDFTNGLEQTADIYMTKYYWRTDTDKFDAESFFVYVGTYSGGIPQFRYLYPTSEGSYNAEKVIWENAPAGLAYGDIFIADGDVPMTQVYPAKDDPANAHVYYYTLDEGAELIKAGNCPDLMEKKDMSVTSKTYDGSSHWSIRYMDAAGEEYYYGLSTFASSLGVDPLDCEVGDVYTYALYNNHMVVPLAKQTGIITDTMTVEVVEAHDKYLLVKPADIPDSNELLTLSTEYIDTGVAPSVGTKYEVTYTDGILETYPEQFGNVTKVTMVSEKNDLLAGQMRVTLVDYDTGEPIILKDDFKLSISTSIGVSTPDGMAYTGPILMMETNPAIVDDNIANFFDADSFSFGLESYSLPKEYSLPDNAERVGYYSGTILPENSITVTRYDNGSADVVFKLKFTPTGDANDDGELTVADVVLLQKWLLAVPDTDLKNWKAVDFCNDNKLNVFDLCLMKRELIRKTVTTYVKPDHEILYGSPIGVEAEEISMYLGPDTSYNIVTSIPQGTILNELGVQENNNNWVFVEYEGQYGWIQMVSNGGETLCKILDLPAADKPVIYLYPEQEADVHVELELTEADLSTTYPKYNNGWDVVAYPDGTLLNKADGTHHKYLFWDAVNCRTRFDFSKGFCVAGSDTESFLKEKLTYMGLTEQEMNEFIVYWLPRMEHNAYNLISFQGDTYADTAKLTITPTPDSMLRIFMTYVPLEDAVDIDPQELSTFERNGFTVVEWGGSEIKTGNN